MPLSESGIEHLLPQSERDCQARIKAVSDPLRAEIERLTRELATVGVITLCATCGGTGSLPGGTAEYPAGGCCPIAHARACSCLFGAWRTVGHPRERERAEANRKLELSRELGKAMAVTADDLDRKLRINTLREVAGWLCDRCKEGDMPGKRIAFNWRWSHVWPPEVGNGHSICEASGLWEKLSDADRDAIDAAIKEPE